MTIKQTILSIQYYALKVYYDAGTKRLKRAKKPKQETLQAVEDLKAAMDAIARQYQATTSEVQPMGDIIPPPPPPPPPEQWP